MVAKLTTEDILAQPAVKYALENPDATQQEVASLYGVARPTVSLWLRRLRADGYSEQLKGQRVNATVTAEELLEHPVIKYLVETEGATQTQAAERFGVSQPIISKWVCRLRDEGYADHLPPRLAAGKPRTTSATLADRYRYTVYGKVQAGDWNGADKHDSTPVGVYHSYLKLSQGPGGEPFALLVSGDSMTDAAASATFPEGAYVLVNPNIEAVSGDFVVAMDTRDGATTFKKLQRNGDKTVLVPLNPAFDPIPVDSPYIRITGVVVEAQMNLYSRATPRAPARPRRR